MVYIVAQGVKAASLIKCQYKSQLRFLQLFLKHLFTRRTDLQRKKRQKYPSIPWDQKLNLLSELLVDSPLDNKLSNGRAAF